MFIVFCGADAALAASEERPRHVTTVTASCRRAEAEAQTHLTELHVSHGSHGSHGSIRVSIRVSFLAFLAFLAFLRWSSAQSVTDQLPLPISVHCQRIHFDTAANNDLVQRSRNHWNLFVELVLAMPLTSMMSSRLSCL